MAKKQVWRRLSGLPNGLIHRLVLPGAFAQLRPLRGGGFFDFVVEVYE